MDYGIGPYDQGSGSLEHQGENATPPSSPGDSGTNDALNVHNVVAVLGPPSGDSDSKYCEPGVTLSSSKDQGASGDERDEIDVEDLAGETETGPSAPPPGPPDNGNNFGFNEIDTDELTQEHEMNYDEAGGTVNEEVEAADEQAGGIGEDKEGNEDEDDEGGGADTNGDSSNLNGISISNHTVINMPD